MFWVKPNCTWVSMHLCYYLCNCILSPSSFFPIPFLGCVCVSVSFFLFNWGEGGGSCFLLMLASCIYNYAYFMFTWDRYCFEECLTPVEYDVSLTNIEGNQHTLQAGAGIAQWLERRTRDWKVAGSNPCWNGGRIFFSRVDFLCWLLFRYPFHPRVTTVARKKSRSFCQKCRWQVTAKHACTLRIEPCFGIGHNLSLICQMTSEDIKHQLNNNTPSRGRG